MPQVISRHSLRVLTQEKDKKEYEKKEKEYDLENLQKEASGDLKLEIKDETKKD
jgi:cell division protein FtsL